LRVDDQWACGQEPIMKYILMMNTPRDGYAKYMASRH